MNDAWDTLAGFESRDLISRHFKKRHGIEANAGKIREIASSFTQGREYFTSAIAANIAVKPLLLYYGVLSLSRGLILFLSPNLRETSLKPSHGLEVTNWQSCLANKDFASLEIRVGNGTFSELLTAVKNKSYFRSNTSFVNWGISFEQPKEGEKLSFYALASGFPDLHRELAAWSNMPYERLGLEGFKIDKPNSKYVITVYGGDSKHRAIEACFPTEVFHNKEVSISKNITSIFLPFPLIHYPRFVYSFNGSFSEIGHINIVDYLPNCESLCDIGQFYMAAYILGMMSRYFPTTWISLGRTEKGDVIYPFILKLIKYIQRYFPKIVLDHLDAPYDFESKSNANKE
ncbi:hypothetical protein GO988_08925 [Hymenobacter sp. HMF4947]|uniref:YaaC family protein n=1 Tax=Hymenobacter ginkgonis TaxID=2682976 RepID=A0A7K1TDG4_9BACT|nr:YaaC family protein [Hymenobacter ginkgonis]MVN76446.1 hypothetical protein [Hymenobacter ginkgonis]